MKESEILEKLLDFEKFHDYGANPHNIYKAAHNLIFAYGEALRQIATGLTKLSPAEIARRTLEDETVV